MAIPPVLPSIEGSWANSSPQMVRKAYAARSQKEDAERWWALE